MYISQCVQLISKSYHVLVLLISSSFSATDNCDNTQNILPWCETSWNLTTDGEDGEVTSEMTGDSSSSWWSANCCSSAMAVCAAPAPW